MSVQESGCNWLCPFSFRFFVCLHRLAIPLKLWPDKLLPWNLTRTIRSTISGDSLVRSLFTMVFCREKILSQSAVCRGSVMATCANLMRLGNSSLWCSQMSAHSPAIEHLGYLIWMTTFFKNRHSSLVATLLMKAGNVSPFSSWNPYRKKSG